LISDLSARFVNISPDQVDGEIDRALERVLEFFQVDRCALLSISPDRKRVYVTYAAYAEGIEQVTGDIDLATLFPWCYERLVVQGLPVNIKRLEELRSRPIRTGRVALPWASGPSWTFPVLGRTALVNYRDQCSAQPSLLACGIHSAATAAGGDLNQRAGAQKC